MTKKIKKKAQEEEVEFVSEDRAFEIFLDTQEKEIVFVSHYRRQWGDQYDMSAEQPFSLDDAKDLLSTLAVMIEELERGGVTKVENGEMENTGIVEKEEKGE